MKNQLESLKDHLRKLEYLNSTIALLQWDMMVMAPKKSINYRSEMLGYLSGEVYKLTTGEEMKRLLEDTNESLKYDDVSAAMIENARKDYNQIKKLPEDLYKNFTIDASKSGAAWEEAKEKSDFSIFAPYLTKMVDYKRKFAEYFGYEKNKYDALLDLYEPNTTVEDIDKHFDIVRDCIVNLLKKIKDSNKVIKDDFFKKYFTKEEQEDFTKFILDKMGYDYRESGRIDESVHPFTINFGKYDVRITNHYYENEFTSALYSAIHEGGHGIYEQNISDDLYGTGLATGVSMGIHESQSRFYENIIGKSKEFCEFLFPEAKKRFPQFEDVTFQEFYEAVNKVEPSLIRTEADELTYSLHIIIRYEIEKLLINGKIEVEELPEVWNDKYEEYLGVRPKSDSEGVLQDMHWSDGSFGYFPSYALGNLYGAQLLNTMRLQIPNMYEKIKQGDLMDIKNWLNENIHKYGAVYKPSTLIEQITGEKLNARYFVEYLNHKYSDIYSL